MKELNIGLALMLLCEHAIADAGAIALPEPSILGLMGIVIGALLFVRKR